MHPGSLLSVRLAVFVLLQVAAVLPVARALVIPSVESVATCYPKFSGLVQQITATSNRRLVLRFEDHQTRMDGLVLDRFDAVKDSPAERSLEWFVSAGRQRGVYTLLSGDAPHTCHSDTQHVLGRTNCEVPHEYRITCEGCDSHEDSAEGCQILSVSRRQCLTMAQSGKSLEWAGCRKSGPRFLRQQFDIRP
ncbi:hypothetical protein T439DRAFT_377939 [Meredithblackwellia eburnea MCA 4105]